MYKVDFSNISEVRMGSTYNVANVILYGSFTPELPEASFQDISIVSNDGTRCCLVEWMFENGDPGFCLWILDENTKKIEKSKRFSGCCEGLELTDSKLIINIWQYNEKTKLGERIVDELLFTAN